MQQEAYVVDQLLKPLLGQPPIESLKLLVRLRCVAQNMAIQNPTQLFPRLFRGLRKMQGDCTIKLKDGAEPFALTTPRRVPIPLMQSVKVELENMEKWDLSLT